jgi:hypothetical protein
MISVWEEGGYWGRVSEEQRGFKSDNDPFARFGQIMFAWLHTSASTFGLNASLLQL